MSQSIGKKDQTTLYMEEAANLICSLQRNLSEVDAKMAAANARSKQIVRHIEVAAQKLMQSIIKHRDKLIAKVGEVTEAKLEALQAEKDGVQDLFRNLENVLRCVLSNASVVDSMEWESAIAMHLNALKDTAHAFDTENYSEELKFHFLYQDEKLLAAVCNFGEVFTSSLGDQNQQSSNSSEDKEECYKKLDGHTINGCDSRVEHVPVKAQPLGGFQETNPTRFLENISSLSEEQAKGTEKFSADLRGNWLPLETREVKI